MRNAAGGGRGPTAADNEKDYRMTQDAGLHNVAPLANVVRLSTLIERIANRAPGLPNMGCFYGPAGLGKTFAGIFMANRYSACHVQALPFGGTKKLFQMIVTELGQRPARTVADLFDQAVAQLARRGCPMIIDEADQILTDRTIEAVRHLADMSGATVILMGEELLPQKLRRWERVNGRMLSWVAAEEATADDLTHLSRIYAGGITLDPSLKEEILKVSGGSIRHVSTNLAKVAEFARSRGRDRVSLADWTGQTWNSAQPPEARQLRLGGEITRRGRAA